jgi:hypothetical protein
MNRIENQWFEVTVNAAHQGSGKRVPTIKYVFAPDPIEAIDSLNRLRGWKRHGPINVRPLSPEAAELLEKIIPEYTSLRISQARREGVHASRLDTGIDLSDVLKRVFAQQEIDS